MLISPDRRIVISNLGWVDRSGLWSYDATKDQDALLPVGDAKYLSLFPCKDPRQFAVLHHYDGASIRVSVHSFEDPATSLCTLQRNGNVSSLQGDAAALEHAPRYYVAYFDTGQDRDYLLLQIDLGAAEIQAERFDWYDSSYDKGYQAIVGLIELPSGILLVSVQRDSHPVVYDPRRRQVLKKISLADRAGNPMLRGALRHREIWADDYDTLLKLDLDSLAVKSSRRLRSSPPGTAQFIGRWILDEDKSLCLVPRPFSGDVLALSMQTMKTERVAQVGGQPLEASLLEGDRLIARDWKTGQLTRAALRRASVI